MKRPDFLKGLEAAPVPSAPRVRPVAWYSPPPPPPSIAPVVIPPVSAPPQLSVVPAPPPSPPPAFTPPPSPPVMAAPTRGDDRALRLALEALRAQGERLAEQARSDALELGVLIARRILEREISTDLGAIFALIKSAVRRAGEDHVTRVRVHPDDAAALQGSTRADFSLGKIELAADASLERGDVMVETEHQSLDGRLSTRFEEIVKHLTASGA